MATLRKGLRRAFSSTATASSSTSKSPIFVTGLRSVDYKAASKTQKKPPITLPDDDKDDDPPQKQVKSSTDIFGRDRRGRLLKKRENEIKVALPSDLAGLACHSARDFSEILPHVFKRIHEVNPQLQPSDRVALLVSFLLGKQGSRQAVSLLFKGLVDCGITKLKVEELVLLMFCLARFQQTHSINHHDEVKVLSRNAVRLLLDVHSPAAKSPTPNQDSAVLSPEGNAKLSATAESEKQMAAPGHIASVFHSLCVIGDDEDGGNLATMQTFLDFLGEQDLDLYSDAEIGSICAAANLDYVRSKIDVAPLIRKIVDCVGGRLFNSNAADTEGGEAESPQPFRLDQLVDVLVAAAKAEVENCDMVLQYLLREVKEEAFIALPSEELATLVFGMGLAARRCGLVRRGRVGGKFTDDLSFVDAYTAITGHLIDGLADLDAATITQVYVGLAAAQFANKSFVAQLGQYAFQKISFFRQKKILTVLEATRQLDASDDMLLEGFARLVLKRGNPEHMQQLVGPLQKAGFANERLINVLTNGGVDRAEQERQMPRGKGDVQPEDRDVYEAFARLERGEQLGGKQPKEREPPNFESEENLQKFANDQEDDIEGSESEEEEEEEEEPLAKELEKDEDEEDRVLRLLQNRPPKEKKQQRPRRSEKDRALAKKLQEDEDLAQFKRMKEKGLAVEKRRSQSNREGTDEPEGGQSREAQRVGGRKSRRGMPAPNPRSELV